MAENKAPRFTIKPNITQEDNGNKLVFLCQIETSSGHDFKWFKENVQLIPSDRIEFKISSVNEKLFNLYLEIKKATSNDSGQYKVIAQNSFGSVSASVNLNFSGIFLF